LLQHASYRRAFIAEAVDAGNHDCAGLQALRIAALHFCRIMSTIFLTKRVATTLLRSGRVRP
jgi:hypothetical protein